MEVLKMEIEKEYKNFLQDLKLKNNKKNKQFFKNLALKTYINFFGINSTQTKKIIEELKTL